MGPRIAVGVVLALLIGLGVWAALPGAAPMSRGDRIGGTPLGSPQPLGVPRPPPAPSAQLPAPGQAAAARPTDELTRRVDACVDAQHEVAARRAARRGPAPAGGARVGGAGAEGCG